ncbi:MAG: hypothetical protein ACTSYD_03830 [Candidatus Heimdallarchaeaceae archaeon]
MSKIYNNITKCLFLVIILSNLSYLVITASLSEYKPGVKAGEWIEYNIGWENCPYTVYQVKVRREILEVTGTKLKINMTIWYSDGTINSTIREGDIIDGTGACALMLIPANLTKGDIVHVQGFDDIKIDGETEKEYLKCKRKVVYANFSSKGFNVLIYWDKVKGVTLEMISKHFHYTSSDEKIYDYSNFVYISNTNMFSSETLTSGENSFLYLLIPTIVFVAGLLFLFTRKKRKSRRKKYRRRRM